MRTVLERTTQKAEKRLYRGGIFTVRVSSKESNNAIVVAEFESVAGCEPPRHVHHREDEIFILKEGTVTFFIGDDIVQAVAGDIVYLPVNVPHHFKFTSDKIKATLVATPGNIENFFLQISEPYEGTEIPPASAPTQEELSNFGELYKSFGMELL